VELKKFSFAYIDAAGGAPSGGAPSRCGFPIRLSDPASRRSGVPAIRRPGGPASR
jgi:hypothetical protein